MADQHTNWKPNFYGFDVLGCEHSLKFPVAKLTDYHDRLEELQASENSFAIVTATHILTQWTRENVGERYRAKQLLVRILYQRQWEKHRVIDLFRVIDWMMRLPDELDLQLWHEIETIEENQKMQYVTSVERFKIAKVRQEAKEEGKEEGALEAEKKTLRRLLQRRFQVIPDWAVERISLASDTDLEDWIDNVLDAATIESVFPDQSSSH